VVSWAKVYAVEAPGRAVDLESWDRGLGLAALALQSHRQTGGLGLACVLLHAGGDSDFVRHVLGGDGPLERRLEAWRSDVLSEPSG
jgi:hypothetical protein